MGRHSVDLDLNGQSTFGFFSVTFLLLLLILFAEWNIRWNVNSKEIGLATVALNHASFSKQIDFRLDGLISINYCSFTGNEVEFTIYNDIYESRPTAEDLKSFKSFVANRTITIFKSKFDVK